MDLLDVTLQNFGSWQALTLPLANQGLTLIQGQSGTGKSTCFRAIYWALFGRTPEGHLADEVVHNAVQNEPTSVTLRLQKGETVYTIQRFRNDPVWKHRVRLFIGAQPVTDADTPIAEAQRMIDQLLGLHATMFTRTLYFVQRDHERFAQLTDTQQKLLLEQVASLDVFEGCQTVVKSRLAALQGKLIAAKSRLDTLENVDTALRKEIRQWHKDKGTRRTQLTRELAKHAAALEDLTLHERHWQRRRSKLPDDSTVYFQVREQLRRAEQELDRAKQVVPGAVCPFCRQEILEAFVDGMIRARQLEVEALAQDWRRVERQHRQLTETQRHLETVRSQLLRTRHTTEVLEASLAATDGEPPQFHTYQHNARVKHRTARQAQQLTYRLPYYTFWHTGFSPSGVRTYFLSALLMHLEGRINYYLAHLRHHPSFSVSYRLDETKIVQRYYGSRTYATLSGGERQLVDLCTGLALRDLAEHYAPETISCLLLDEPFHGLDAALEHKTYRLLPTINKASVFVISHSGLPTRFERVYQVAKRHGVSYLLT